MSVRIRLRRMGKKKQPHYRIVVADGRSPRDGRFVENLGYYNPLPSPARMRVDLERLDYWLGKGAVISGTVASLVSKARSGGNEVVALDRVGENGGTGSGDAAAAGEDAGSGDQGSGPEGSQGVGAQAADSPDPVAGGG